MSGGLRLMTPKDIEDAVAAVSAMPPALPATSAARRAIARRARVLSASHLVPKQWLNPIHPTHPTRTVTAAPTPHDQEPLDDDPISMLAAETGISVKAIRTAYMRGVRDYAMISPTSGRRSLETLLPSLAPPPWSAAPTATRLPAPMMRIC